MKKINLLCFAIFYFWVAMLFAQTNLYKDAVVTPATCGEKNGSITVEAPFFVDAVWEDGSTGFSREEIGAGTYTLSGVDERGCSESLVFQVPSVSCDFELTYTYPYTLPNPEKGLTDGPSRPEVCVYVGFIFSIGGVPIDLEYLDVSWAVTVPPIPPYVSFTYYPTDPYVGVYTNNTIIEYTISLKGQAFSCCSFSDVINVGTPCKEPIEPPKVYVSKSTFTDAAHQAQVPGIVDLLVYGDGTCGETMDLRGYIVDDNNGDLIYAQQTDLTSGAGLNIDPGYLRFSDDPNWAAVPHGSIITIYESAHLSNEAIKAKNDPTDANGDFHYVLSAENSAYLQGMNSSWSTTDQLVSYDQTVITPAWGLIRPDGGAGAIQVRYPDGSYCHGISYGKTDVSATYNFFALHLSETSHAYCQIHMQSLSYLDKEAFSIYDITGGFTPGQTESASLSTTVNYLRNCDNPSQALTTPVATTGNGNPVASATTKTTNATTSSQTEETLDRMQVPKIEHGSLMELLPNPFQQYLQVNYQSAVEGWGSIQVFDPQGKLVFTQSIAVKRSQQQLTIDFAQRAAGLYLIKFQTPDHKIIAKKAVLTHSR